MFTYIASPYSDPDKEVVVERYYQVLQFTADMTKSGLVCYSPIVHCHFMSAWHGMPTDFKFWREFNLTMLASSKALIVLTLEGWQQSKGVAAEIAYARDHKIPVSWMSPKNENNSDR
jgi:hypothetical protein